MVHFTVILSILLSTSAVLGSPAYQNKAESEELCDSASKGRVVLQKGQRHEVEGAVEEVADVSTVREDNSLTQSGLAAVSQKEKWWNPRPAPSPPPPPADQNWLEKLMQLKDHLIQWILGDFKKFANLLGIEWYELDYTVQTKIIESNPDNRQEVLGKDWNSLSEDARTALTDGSAGFLQVFSQKQAFTEGRKADLHPVWLQVSHQKEEKFWGYLKELWWDTHSTVRFSTKMYSFFGNRWASLPVWVQSRIVNGFCKDAEIDKLMDTIRAMFPEEEDRKEKVKEIQKRVTKAFEDICLSK